MKKFIDTLKNIWKIEDLRQRILITVLFVAIYRFGSKVLLPGISYNQLDDLRKQTANGLMCVPNLAALLAMTGKTAQISREEEKISREHGKDSVLLL